MSMSDHAPVLQSELDLKLLHRGKVRDVYEIDAETLLMVASDRVSAFDVVLPQPIPFKGEVLTLVTAWWLEQLETKGIGHHLIAVDPDVIIDRHPDLAASREVWQRRSMLVHRTKPVLVECVVRGYITGSAWKEYKQSGTLAGEPLPKGLQESQRLDPPIFSPATKAREGEHDENITYGQVIEILGQDLADRLRDLSRQVYEYGRDVAGERNIILADTKFEFGHLPSGELLLIDEVLTPDSSRFWPKETYRIGRGQPSLDKQPIRDWLDGLKDWDKTPPAPDLPPEVVSAASERYQDVFRRLTGVPLSAYVPPRFGTDR
jgi:phosphoribosylaminoimidazole-succinocarboxamide synthase